MTNFSEKTSIASKYLWICLTFLFRYVKKDIFWINYLLWEICWSFWTSDVNHSIFCQVWWTLTWSITTCVYEYSIGIRQALVTSIHFVWPTLVCSITWLLELAAKMKPKVMGIFLNGVLRFTSHVLHCFISECEFKNQAIHTHPWNS